MAETNKLKILYVLDIMRKTDEQHPINISQIAEKLWSVYGVKAERKSIGRDLQTLEDNVPIEGNATIHMTVMMQALKNVELHWL